MSSVSSSASSPDALGPEGDALYLISSPVPEFSGRQSWVPPYTIQTPRRQERMPRRTPKQQTSQTMRFNDIILPASPHMRQRSMSPTKMQSEGNLSPWRIRVTVEAEHEDDEHTQDGPRKKLKPSTITTKVPLKDEESNSPSAKKRRGRPRKSDVREKSLSPIKGSPGRTPKQQPPDSVKRPRGRPRKSMQTEPVAQSIEAVESPVRNNMQSTTLDGVIDRESPEPFMTADMGTPSNASSEPDPFLDMAGSGAFEEQSPRPNSRRFSPPVVFDLPDSQNAKPTPAAMSAQQATPQASVSPIRFHTGTTPVNTLHAGHTPRKLRRSYPTPTSSSLVDGTGEPSTTAEQHNGTKSITDPTDVHHEYDTIMESEDFSMVSLDTLPSAKQAGLSSILSSSKSSLKPFSEKQNAVSTENTNGRTTKSPQVITSHVPGPSTTPHSKPVGLQNGHESDDQVVPVAVDTVAMNASVPEPFVRPAVEKSKKKFLSLARTVRLGLSLHDTLIHQNLDAEDSDEEEEDIASAADRLKHIFGDLDMESQRHLQAGLRFGELVARGTMRSRRLRRQEERELEARERETSEEEEPVELPQQADTFSDEDSPEEEDLPEEEMSRTQRMEAQWQRERELVSRQIDMAGSDNVIVLDSDDVSVQNGAEERVYEEDEANEEKSEEDDDYGDVWQEEARNHDSSSNRHSTFASSMDEKRPSTTNHRQGSSYRNISQRYYWNPDKGEIPPLGRSRTAQLRDEEVDLSLLLKPRDTPKSRQYYGMSPRTASSQRLQSDRSSRYGGPSRDASSPVERSSLGNGRANDELEDIQDDVEEDNEMLDDDLIEEQEEDEEQEQGEDEQEHDQDDDRDRDNVYIPEEREATDEHTPFDPSITTPEQTMPGPKQSWFRRITNNFTPGWWTTSKEVPLDESQSPPFPMNEQTPSLKRSRAARDAEEAREIEQVTPAISTIQSRIKKHRLSSLPSPRVLATSGYFTDAHYVALKRLYWEAKRYPERFPYHPTAHRDEMLGDSLWTSDGEHGLPIAKIQFGILDRFVSELISADIRNGGRGQIGWTEDDLHKRLFSIIVGEEIRRERMEQRLLNEMR
ncbi:hypothetical protein DPV78_002860 [Talaromyces pinophilus]|nr:hypothetical protein DPV78_002860 [Talaromyces pinophilus]